MKLVRVIFPVLLLATASVSRCQDEKAADPTAPPSLVRLTHQEIVSGKAGERQKLEVARARGCARLEVPLYWIRLQSLSGASDALYFDPFESFEELEHSLVLWNQLYAAHPDLARVQEESEVLAFNPRSIVATRRDDLGYRAENIDLATTRFLRLWEIHIFPGHQNDLVEAIKLLADAFTKVKTETSWVVYEADVGAPNPTFVIFVPMSTLAENDDLLAAKQSLPEAAGEQGFSRLLQIARESISGSETNLYAVRPEMSHVPKQFAAVDAAFWFLGTESVPNTESKAVEKPAKKKD